MMRDWNVVVTVHSEGYREARRLLQRYGAVAPTDFYNVLVMKVADTRAFLRDFAARVEAEPGTLNFVSHLMPVELTFDFTGAEEFEAKAREAVLGWADRLAGKRFHVRFHRRGFKGELKSPDEERFLDDALLAALDAAGTPGRIAFDDADAIIAVETVGPRAGLALWTRDEIERYPFLGID